MKIHELRKQRAKHAADARTLLDQAQEAGRDLTAEESQQFDRYMDEADKLDTSIQREERLQEQERRNDEQDPDGRQREQRGNGDRNGPDGGGRENDAETAFRSYLAGGRNALTAEQQRALNMGSDPEGGFLVAPQKFVQDLLQGVDDAVDIRRLATKHQITDNESLGVPSLDTDLNDADWTSEIGTGNQDDSLRFGKRELRPHPLAKRVKISRTLLRRGTLGPESIVRQRLEYKFGVTTEKAYMTGDGNQKPLGLFTASSQGISTSRDVQVGASGDIPLTNATADQLIDAKYTLKAAYYRRAQWLFHRDLIKRIRKLKDTDGNYLWRPGLASDRPDTILDLPFLINEFVPNTVAADAYVGMLGDYSFYWIADALDMEIQRLVELYAETNQVGFIGRLETDGMPVLEEPFIRLKVKATA